MTLILTECAILYCYDALIFLILDYEIDSNAPNTGSFQRRISRLILRRPKLIRWRLSWRVDLFVTVDIRHNKIVYWAQYDWVDYGFLSSLMKDHERHQIRQHELCQIQDFPASFFCWSIHFQICNIAGCKFRVWNSNGLRLDQKSSKSGADVNLGVNFSVWGSVACKFK